MDQSMNSFGQLVTHVEQNRISSLPHIRHEINPIGRSKYGYIKLKTV